MRTAICKALASRLAAEVNGSRRANLYDNVQVGNIRFDDVTDSPTVTVTPGTATREYLPANQTWAYQTVYVRIYVKDDVDCLDTLESVISDIEYYVQKQLSLNCEIKFLDGTVQNIPTVNSEVTSIITDEGILEQKAFAEITLQVQYQTY